MQLPSKQTPVNQHLETEARPGLVEATQNLAYKGNADQQVAYALTGTLSS